MEDTLSKFIPVLFFAFFGYVLWSMFSKKGRGRMLGGTIIESAKDEIVQKKGIATLALRAHVIETSDGSRHVGLELSENAKLGASMTPIKLTKNEAEKLIGMISETAAKT